MPLCEGHLCKQMQADAADITTHVPLRGASKPVLIHLRSPYITTRASP